MAAELANVDGSILSLLPRTLAASSGATAVAAAAAAAVSEKQELDALKTFYKSMESSSSILEQAKIILNGTSDPSLPYSEDGDEASNTNVKDNLRGRRPALERKRARFSFKPSASHSSVDIGLTSSLDHLKDPEEYFATFERMENAEKELKRLMGEVSTDPSQHMLSTTARKRRPGIIGKKARYKHYFPTHAEGAESLVLSQEKVQTSSSTKNTTLSNSFSPSKNLPYTSWKMQTDANGIFDSSNREGLLNNKENGVDGMLDLVTLSSSFEGLKEGEETAFLQKYLQIEPLYVDKLRLTLLDKVQNNARVMNDFATRQKLDKSQVIPASPSLPNSAHAMISVLKKRISQIDPLKDPYLVPITDDKASPELFSSDEGRERKALSPSVDNDLPNIIGLNTKDAFTPPKEGSRLSFERNSQSPTPEGDNYFDDHVNFATPLMGNSSCPPDRNMGDNSSVLERERGLRSIRVDGCSEKKVDAMLLEASILKQPGPGLEELPSKAANCNGAEESAEQLDDRVPVGGNLDNDISVDFEIGGISDEKVSDTLQEGLALQEKDQSSLVAETALPRDGLLENSNISPEQHNEESQTISVVSADRQVRRKAIPQRKNKQKSTNQESLADAGTVWEAGVRRSKRIRMRPLEYWRGERVLYGRIHESLATVIGLKYASPDKNGGKPVLKVKSYVSEEYAELLERAALH